MAAENGGHQRRRREKSGPCHSRHPGTSYGVRSMRRRKKLTFDEWMKLRAKQQEGIKTPVIVMIPAKPPVKDGLADEGNY